VDQFSLSKLGQLDRFCNIKNNSSVAWMDQFYIIKVIQSGSVLYYRIQNLYYRIQNPLLFCFFAGFTTK